MDASPFVAGCQPYCCLVARGLMGTPMVVVTTVVASSLSGCTAGDSCHNAADMLACSYPAERDTPRQADSTPIPLSTSSWKPGGDRMLMGIEGRIQLSKDDCVYLEGPGGAKNDVIWPAGYSADASPDGVLTLRNPAGEPVGHEGTKVSVAGGDFSGDEGGNIPELVCEAANDSVLYINDELPPL